MIDPTELLALARDLVAHPSPPGQARLRRAISTAYYAVFHTVLRGAAEHFHGDPTSGAYRILYRSFDHAHMKRVCETLQVSTLKQEVRSALRRETIGTAARDFAGSFPSHQEARHLADCDPTVVFEQGDAADLIDAAEAAVQDFARIPVDERADILALLMVRART